MHPRHLSISVASPEWKKYLNQKIDEYEQWYGETLIPLKSSGLRIIALQILKSNMNKLRSALREPNDDINFKFWYERIDVSRGTDFKKTFPELEWHIDRLV
jgi:hypothetical protein